MESGTNDVSEAIKIKPSFFHIRPAACDLREFVT